MLWEISGKNFKKYDDLETIFQIIYYFWITKNLQ